jgi:hypothetical protein
MKRVTSKIQLIAHLCEALSCPDVAKKDGDKIIELLRKAIDNQKRKW